ncbi:MAG: hypothetical protein U5K76_09385 [Woeseiaceae bacterium]|nr:hypothetical protein [Woeseiaceae bacterium]
MTLAWHDVVGTLGVLFIVGTYFLLQLGRLHSTLLSFSILNAAGAALILVSLTQEFNLAAFLIESIWLLISVYGIVANLARRKDGKPVVRG